MNNTERIQIPYHIEVTLERNGKTSRIKRIVFALISAFLILSFLEVQKLPSHENLFTVAPHFSP